MIQKKLNISLSEQNLIDCSGFGDCSAGFPDVAFNYIKRNGINIAQSYQYKGSKGSSCKRLSFNGTYSISSFETIFNDESKMQIAIDVIGPIVVFFSSQLLQAYTGGIMGINQTCSLYTDHVALAVGYGTDPSTGTDYYIVKNSWGSLWGEGGYFRIIRGENMCGIGLKG